MSIVELFTNCRFTLLLLGIALVGFTRSVPAQEQSEPPSLSHEDKAEILDSILKPLDSVYIFPEKAEAIRELVEQKLTKGQYDSLATTSEFLAVVLEDMTAVTGDRHLRVDIIPPDELEMYRQGREEELHQHTVAKQRRTNFGFEEIKILSGNIGYLKFDSFPDTADAGMIAIAAMNYLANCDALIFDLRSNGGGSPAMIQLIASYLFAQPVHLNDFLIPSKDSVREFWTYEAVTGPLLTDIPVYVLTSNYTFSAAEEFAYDLQSLKRATIIGATTGGGAHEPDEFHCLSLGIQMLIPYGRAINPITGTNWEGTGVTPDIEIDPDKALPVARLEALGKLLEQTTDEDYLCRLTWQIDGLKSETNPPIVAKINFDQYCGQYGPRRVWIENDKLFYARDPNPPRAITPMGDDLFSVEGLDWFRIKFERDESGRTVRLHGLYNNCNNDMFDRTSD